MAELVIGGLITGGGVAAGTRVVLSGDASGEDATDDEGNWSVATGLQNDAAHTFTVTVPDYAGWTVAPGESHPATVETEAGGGPTYTVQLDFVAAPRTCRDVLSSYVARLCWLPATHPDGPGVAATLKDWRGLPHVTVVYPGTTQKDYEQWLAAPSKGKHLHAVYYGRPYKVIKPP